MIVCSLFVLSQSIGPAKPGPMGPPFLSWCPRWQEHLECPPRRSHRHDLPPHRTPRRLIQREPRHQNETCRCRPSQAGLIYLQHVKQFSCPSPATTAVTAASGADDSFSLTLDDENTGEGEKKLAARKAAAFCSRVPFKKRRGNVDRSPLASLDNKTVATPASTLSTTSEISNIHNTVIRNYAGDAAPVIPSSASARRTTMDIETMIRAVDSRRPFLFFPGSCSQDFTQ